MTDVTDKGSSKSQSLFESLQGWYYGTDVSDTSTPATTASVEDSYLTSLYQYSSSAYEAVTVTLPQEVESLKQEASALVDRAALFTDPEVVSAYVTQHLEEQAYTVSQTLGIDVDAIKVEAAKIQNSLEKLVAQAEPEAQDIVEYVLGESVEHPVDETQFGETILTDELDEDLYPQSPVDPDEVTNSSKEKRKTVYRDAPSNQDECVVLGENESAQEGVVECESPRVLVASSQAGGERSVNLNGFELSYDQYVKTMMGDFDSPYQFEKSNLASAEMMASTKAGSEETYTDVFLGYYDYETTISTSDPETDLDNLNITVAATRAHNQSHVEQDVPHAESDALIQTATDSQTTQGAAVASVQTSTAVLLGEQNASTSLAVADDSFDVSLTFLTNEELDAVSANLSPEAAPSFKQRDREVVSLTAKPNLQSGSEQKISTRQSGAQTTGNLKLNRETTLPAYTGDGEMEISSGGLNALVSAEKQLDHHASEIEIATFQQLPMDLRAPSFQNAAATLQGAVHKSAISRRDMQLDHSRDEGDYVATLSHESQAVNASSAQGDSADHGSDDEARLYANLDEADFPIQNSVKQTSRSQIEDEFLLGSIFQSTYTV